MGEACRVPARRILVPGVRCWFQSGAEASARCAERADREMKTGKACAGF